MFCNLFFCFIVCVCVFACSVAFFVSIRDGHCSHHVFCSILLLSFPVSHRVLFSHFFLCIVIKRIGYSPSVSLGMGHRGGGCHVYWGRLGLGVLLWNLVDVMVVENLGVPRQVSVRTCPATMKRGVVFRVVFVVEFEVAGLVVVALVLWGGDLWWYCCCLGWCCWWKGEEAKGAPRTSWSSSYRRVVRHRWRTSRSVRRPLVRL